jgi:hypothetical protein
MILAWLYLDLQARDAAGADGQGFISYSEVCYGSVRYRLRREG